MSVADVLHTHIAFTVGLLVALATFDTRAASPSIGAAPKGDANAVASRIIKDNFPACKRVSGAARASDGSIRARCDGVNYLVFTVFNAKDERLHEVAMNCTAARRLLNVAC